MPWAKGTAVKDAKGAEAQWRMALEKIKSRLEEMGSSLENIVFMTIYVTGPFPEGAASSPNYRLDVMDEFFREHCPQFCSDNNPPASDLVGVAALGLKEVVVEISCVAAIPD